MMNCT